ncbi:SURF1 family-domain-containing protein [Microdochium trichocladiopsis]|uniref:SURF1-like protein n=1 Tax=Microdochium trichocladiopsis TaxID=1682393 RepID=A0A9P8YDY9_9PEZI|nr:SURF1 family-domain-containing protein [Microdochium trichocladiopsis]KAH7037117.1 SURF1 family-domain-containing protein [Microdochium trichocladiopsis]
MNSSWVTRQLARRVEGSLNQAGAAQCRNSSSSTSRSRRTATPPTCAAASRQQRQPPLAQQQQQQQKHQLNASPPNTSRRFFSYHHHPRAKQAADDPNFSSILDNPPDLVRTGRRHGPGLIILAIIPITALALGTWQVQRLGWKTELIAKFEDRLVREPLPLPPRIDPDAIHDFDFRRVVARGKFRHDLEMLVGPRMRDGEQGFMVVTPLEREGGSGGGQGGGETATVLVNRGWISKTLRDQRNRHPSALPRGEVTVEGLLREPWKKNMFTPENRPDLNEFYFPDVKQMAALTGSQAVWVEQTMEPSLMQVIDYQNKGIPIGRAAEVNLRNNHAQYIFTWYGLAVATSIMFYMVVKKPPTEVTRRVRQNRDWR